MTDAPYTRATLAGAAAGLRAFTAPAATLAGAGHRYARIATVLAAGELLADKLPMAPPRTTLPSLGVRLVSGAACGAFLARRGGGAAAIGGLLGAIAAYATTFGGYAYRSFGAERIPDLPLALVEDALAVGAARYANGAAA